MEKQDFKQWLRVRTDTPEPVNEILGTAALIGAGAYAASQTPWAKKGWSALKKMWNKPRRESPPDEVPTPHNPRAAEGDIENHPHVDKFYKALLSNLMLDGSHDIVTVDTGERVSEIPSRIQKVLRSYVAAHVLEGKSTQLRVSYPQAVEIIRFLSGIKVEGEDESLAEKFDATSPRGLTVFVQNNVETSPTLNFQYGYDRDMPKKKKKVEPGLAVPTSPWESSDEMKELAGILRGLVGDRSESGKGFLRRNAEKAASALEIINRGKKTAGFKAFTSTAQMNFLVKAVNWIDKHLPSIEAKAEDKSGHAGNPPMP